jgi:hypothetical protein
MTAERRNTGARQCIVNCCDGVLLYQPWADARAVSPGARSGLTMEFGTCKCGHPAKLHVYPNSTLYGDCHDCRCELYNPPGGLEGVPLHPLFAFTADEFRFVSCNRCNRFHVLPEGVCDACGWDNDNQGPVEDTRPDYCLHSPTRKHVIPLIVPSVPSNYCRYCLRTISEGKTTKRERVRRYWQPPTKEP